MVCGSALQCIAACYCIAACLIDYRALLIDYRALLIDIGSRLTVRNLKPWGVWGLTEGIHDSRQIIHGSDGGALSIKYVGLF